MIPFIAVGIPLSSLATLLCVVLWRLKCSESFHEDHGSLAHLCAQGQLALPCLGLEVDLRWS